MSKQKKFAGFTLIEILVVVALIAILTAITYIAINPAKNFADTRNTQRSSDVTQILNAVTEYTAEESHQLSDFGTIAICLTGTPMAIIDGTGTPTAGQINLQTLLVDTYIVGIPHDPNQAAGNVTGYTMCRTAGNRVEIDAPQAELSKVISVRR